MQKQSYSLSRSFQSYLIIFFSFIMLALSAASAHSGEVTLEWDPNTEPELAGYKVYYGTASGDYQHHVDVGSYTGCTISGLDEDKTYYFAATAYDSSGYETDFSDEIAQYIPKADTDTDGDGLTDADETAVYGTDPDNADSDGDGISDGAEADFWGDDWDADGDGDGLINLLDQDADNDGVTDGLENSNGSDPSDPHSIPAANDSETLCEDAEDGTTTGWDIYDNSPAEASVTNVFDEDRQSRVIQLTGSATDNGYRLRNEDGSGWQNSSQFVAEWSMKYSESFIVFIDAETTAGHRYIYYTSTDSEYPGNEQSVHHGLGSNVTDGQWHTFVRDLQADLEDVQPGVTILEVNGLLIRGSGRVDDVKLRYADTDGDSLTDADETAVYGTDPDNADSDGDGISDGAEADFWGNDWDADYDNDGLINLLDQDADNDGVTDGLENSNGSDPSDPHSIPAANDSETLCEDAEDGTTTGWDIYDNSPAEASVTNVFDEDRQSRVIQLTGSATDNGYRLRNEDGSGWQNSSQFVAEWSMKYSESFIVFIDVETTAGQRYIYYTSTDSEYTGNEQSVHHGLGSNVTDGQWHTFVRDLQADLEDAQPGVTILEVNGLLIRGSGRVDDIKLRAHPAT